MLQENHVTGDLQQRGAGLGSQPDTGLGGGGGGSTRS